MIKLNREELKNFFPYLADKIQEHHNMEDVASELFIKRTPRRGLSQLRNYFLEIDDDVFLQYYMEHTIVAPEIFLIARTLVEVILYDSKREFELARIADRASVTNQKYNLN